MSNTKGQFKEELANNPGKPDCSKYDTRVRKVAEEMAKDTHPGTWQAAKGSLIEHFTPAARIAVKHMAAEAREAWQAGRLAWWAENGELEDGEESNYDTWTDFSKKRGLIHSPNQPEEPGK